MAGIARDHATRERRSPRRRHARKAWHSQVVLRLYRRTDFSSAECPVLTFGPHTDGRPWFGTSSTQRAFLFATDFGSASLRALPQAIAAANQFGARLAFLSIVPCAPSHTDEGVKNWQTDAYTRTQRRLTELADDAGLDTRPQLYVEFQSARPVSEQILETADKLRADLIIMGLHDSAHAGIVSHLDLATTYDVVCQAGSPVLTVNCSSEYDLRARPTNATASPYPEAMGSAVTGLDRSDRRERESPSTR